MPRGLKRIFDIIQTRNLDVTVKLSIVEIYNDKSARQANASNVSRVVLCSLRSAGS